MLSKDRCPTTCHHGKGFNCRICYPQKPITFEAAKANYLQRFTMEHVPSWALNPVAEALTTRHRYYAPQYRSDAEWYALTDFPTPTARDQSCHSRTPTFPLGRWLAKPYVRGMPWMPYDENADIKQVTTHDKQVCALRELVAAHKALAVAYQAFYLSLGPLDDDALCEVERATCDWLEDCAPADSRDVKLADLFVLLSKAGV
jgi:hypothetical protein